MTVFLGLILNFVEPVEKTAHFAFFRELVQVLHKFLIGLVLLLFGCLAGVQESRDLGSFLIVIGGGSALRSD